MTIGKQVEDLKVGDRVVVAGIFVEGSNEGVIREIKGEGATVRFFGDNSIGVPLTALTKAKSPADR